MNIGIDIDNVISKFDEALEEEFLKHDKELRNTGIINPNNNDRWLSRNLQRMFSK